MKNNRAVDFLELFYNSLTPLQQMQIASKVKVRAKMNKARFLFRSAASTLRKQSDP